MGERSPASGRGPRGLGNRWWSQAHGHDACFPQAACCELLPVKQVAKLYGLGWETVKEINKCRLQRTLPPVDLSGVRVTQMDEFAIHKGHRYATVVVDPLSRRMLWVGRGRARKDVRPFFELLGA